MFASSHVSVVMGNGHGGGSCREPLSRSGADDRRHQKGNPSPSDRQPDRSVAAFGHSTSVSPSLYCKGSANRTINYKRAWLAASAGRAACLTNTILSWLGVDRRERSSPRGCRRTPVAE